MFIRSLAVLRDLLAEKFTQFDFEIVMGVLMLLDGNVTVATVTIGSPGYLLMTRDTNHEGHYTDTDMLIVGLRQQLQFRTLQMQLRDRRENNNVT